MGEEARTFLVREVVVDLQNITMPRRLDIERRYMSSHKFVSFFPTTTYTYCLLHALHATMAGLVQECNAQRHAQKHQCFFRPVPNRALYR